MQQSQRSRHRTSIAARTRSASASLIAVLAALLLVGAAGCGSSPEATAASNQVSAETETTGEDTVGKTANETVEQSPTSSPTSETNQDEPGRPSEAAHTEPSKKRPNTNTRLVVRVIDGDTVELGNGQSVRVIGIDTPERGQCHYETATRRMQQMVEGKRVVLTRHGGENADHYGRLLRYLDIGNIDPGLRLIKEGLAIARYDSRDGYGYHPREPRYIQADNATPQRTCAPAPAPEPAPKPEPQPNTGCADGYSPCVPPYPPDVNCADVDGPITVTGSDPHGLDRDGDGIACES